MNFNLTLLMVVLCINSAIPQQDSVIEHKVDSLYILSEHLYDKNNYKDAIKVAIDAINLAHKTKNKTYLSKCYALLGNEYLNLNDSESAKSSFIKALGYAKQEKDTISLCRAYNGLGNILSDKEKKYEEGIGYYKKSVLLLEKLNDTTRLVSCLTNIGWTYLDMKEPDNAQPYILKSIKLDNAKRKDLTADILYLKGVYHYQKNQLNKAILSLNKSLKIANQESYFFIIADVYKLRSLIYKKVSQFHKAYNDVVLYAQYNDSVIQFQRTKEFEAAKAKFAVQEAKRELSIAKQKQLLFELRAQEHQRKLFFAIVTSLFLLGLLYMYFRNRVRKRDNAILIEKNEILIEAKEKADQLNALKTQFISTVSHELRTPLYGIIGTTNLLNESNENLTHEQKEQLEALKQSSDFLLKHINDVLRIKEIESRPQSINPKSTNLRDVMKRLKDDFEDKVSENANKIIITIDEKAPKFILIDELRLTEILLNLIDNACKFTKNGTIWVRVKVNKTIKTNTYSLLFEVEDNGMGISEDKREIIFDKFYQANRGQKNLDGTGLGLSVVKYLLHALNSEITLQSKEGVGSTFSFTLKVKGEGVADNDATILKNKAKHTFIKRTILVAEDNKISQAITKKMIETLGHKCVISDNGLEALNKTKHQHFDLVLMDLNMPVMDGIDATKHILKHNKHAHIVALTALDLDQIKNSCYEVGMLYVVNKPLSKGDLKLIISKYSQNKIA